MAEQEKKFDQVDVEMKGQSLEKLDAAATDGIGVAFSGGGIRSAAFSSGVLRRLLQKNIPVDYMSCVSGGGYTGTAYLEWKYRNGGVDNAQWHEKFFNQMRKNASSQCNWINPIVGCFDTLGVIILITVVVFIVPAIIWIPLAFPLAYLVDYFFGRILRMGFVCRQEAIFNETIQNMTLPGKHNQSLQAFNCFPLAEKDTEFQAVFYASILLAMVICYSLSEVVAMQIQYLFKLVAGVLLVILAFTFLPWFFELYLAHLPSWIKIIVFLLGAVLWMGIPPIRSKASWTLIIYIYSFIINYKVFRNPVLGVTYDAKFFIIITWAASGLFLLAPFLKIFQQSCIHSFYRCKLQKAFYTKRSAGMIGCTGITFADFFPMISPYKRSSYEEIEGDKSFEKATLTLKDLDSIKPYYICNVLVDNWIYIDSPDPRIAFTVLTISPHLIERIDDDDYKDFDHNTIGPGDIRLSDAMATSGAVVSYNMGEYKNEAALSLQMMLGVSMGKTWISDKRLLKKTVCGALVPILVQIIIFLPLLLMPAVELNGVPTHTGYGIMAVFVAFLAICFVVAILPTGKSRKSILENLTRWCIVNIYQVRFIREILSINNVGEVPPAILYLSDGGHVENLGLLPLLKRRMRRIIVTDGGFKASFEAAGIDLLHSLDMARRKLRCSFTGTDGRDIYEDIRDHFVEPKLEKFSRKYEFRVHYYEKDNHTGVSRKVGEGIILLLAPRHPSEGIVGDEMNSWSEYEADTGLKLKAKRWGNGPYLSGDEANRLTGACSDCCHCSCCKVLSEPLFGRFPQHSTANQFFTQDLFSAYHREGYRSSIEGSLDEFLKEA